MQCRGVTAVQRHDLSRMCTFTRRNGQRNLPAGCNSKQCILRRTFGTWPTPGAEEAKTDFYKSIAVAFSIPPPPPRRRKSQITKHNHKAQITKHKSPFSMVCGRPGSQSHCACNSCSSILVTERPGSAEHLAAKLAAPFLDRSTGRPPRSRISARPPAAVPRNETRSVLVLGASSVRVDGRRKGGKRSLAIAAAPL